MYIKKTNDYSFVLPTGKGFGNFIVRTYKPIPYNYKTVTITKRKNNYYVTFIYEVQETLNKWGEGILAIDLGIKTLVTGITSDSEEVIVNKFSHKAKHLDILRSKRDNKKKGSRRWKKLNLTFQKRLEQYKNRIEDYLHKSSKFIINNLDYSTIVVGKLNLEGMINPKQGWFNKIICNEWRVKRFVEMLKYKSQLHSKTLIEIDERYTTKTCCRCSNRKDMKLSDRIYRCDCGLTLDRDLNSAFNIMKKYSTASAIELSNSIRNNIENMLFDLEIIKFKYI